MNRRAWLAAASLMLAGLGGCGPSGPAKYKVTGNVTWNGSPLPEGQIVFTPEDPKVSADAGKIVNGAFDVLVKPGSKRVEIYASREGTKVDPAMGAAPREAYIPERYNAKTILKADVTPGGENRFTYTLTEKP
jgi:hypothetical protein